MGACRGLARNEKLGAFPHLNALVPVDNAAWLLYAAEAQALLGLIAERLNERDEAAAQAWSRDVYTGAA